MICAVKVIDRERRGYRCFNTQLTFTRGKDRSETGEAALERSRRDGSKALLKFFLKGHVFGH